MKCPKCKREIDDNSAFCEYCGYKIKKSKWPLVLLIIVILVGIILSMVMRLNDKMSAKAEEQRLFEHCSSVSDYRYYVSTYPNGEYVILANNKIRQHENDSIKIENEKAAAEMLAFNNCVSALTCRSYLRNYPTGKYVETVNNRLNKFVNDSIEEANKLYNDSLYDSIYSEKTDINRIKAFVGEYSRATVENDYAAIEKLYAIEVKRYQSKYDTDRNFVMECYKDYDDTFGVYGKHSNVRWNTLETELADDEIYVTYIEDYSIDRYDKSKYSKFVLEKHIILNDEYEIVSVYDVQLEKKK